MLDLSQNDMRAVCAWIRNSYLEEQSSIQSQYR